MCCGPRGPVLSIVMSMAFAFSRFTVTVVVRSGHLFSMTASSAVSLRSRCLQSDLAAGLSFAAGPPDCFIRLSVQIVILVPGFTWPPPPSRISISYWPFCWACMPLNIFGMGMSWATAGAPKINATVNAAEAAMTVFMAYLPCAIIAREIRAVNLVPAAPVVAARAVGVAVCRTHDHDRGRKRHRAIDDRLDG